MRSRDFSQRTRSARVRRQVGPHAGSGHRVERGVLATQEQFDLAWDILDTYQKATEDDRKGAVMFGDEMTIEASRETANKFVARGSAPGYALSGSLAFAFAATRLFDESSGDRPGCSRRPPRNREHPGVHEETAYGYSSA